MKAFIKLIVLLAAGLAVFCGIQFSVKTFQVFDISMEPSFKSGDYILVNKMAYMSKMPSRGDVIALNSPDDSSQIPSDVPANRSQYIKRVIAVGGDTVEIKDQKVYVNGCLIDEPYIAEPCGYDYSIKTIPADSYYVLGDNRNHSYDSHRGWLVPQEDVIGKVDAVYWHSEYPDIRIAVIPAALFIIVLFSTDGLTVVRKKKTRES